MAGATSPASARLEQVRPRASQAVRSASACVRLHQLLAALRRRRSKVEEIADPNICCRWRPCRQLDDRPRAERCGHAPWPDLGHHAYCPPVTVDKDDVDRETHECRVDGGAG